MTEQTPQVPDQATDYPRNWVFDEDGTTVEGRYVTLTAGFARGKEIPILVLEVADPADGQSEQRSVWLFHRALGSQIARELMKRTKGDFDIHEKITIARGEKKQSEANPDQSYYDTAFENAVAPNPRALLANFITEDIVVAAHDDSDDNIDYGHVPFD